MRTLKINLVLCALMLVFPVCAFAFSISYCGKIQGQDALSQFHIAVCKGDVKSVKKFIENGINLNQKFIVNAQFWERNNHYEFNALHTALSQYKYTESRTNKDNYKQIIEIILKNGIDTECPLRHWSSKDINTPPNHISEHLPINMASDYEIADLLKKGGAKMSPLIFVKQIDEYKYFKGNIVVSGEINFYSDNDQWFPGRICMNVDKETSYLIPRVNDSRIAWFCLDRDEMLLSKMKIDNNILKNKCLSGYAKIEITNYRQYIRASEGCDDATLVNLIKGRDYIYKECEDTE